MRKVAIVARGGTHRLAPFRDPEWEIWGMPWIRYPRLDRAFEIHSEQMIAESGDNWYTRQQWLTEFNEKCGEVDVWCDPSRMRCFKKAVEYPLAEIRQAFPDGLLENSICYMLALAIHERRPEIALYGVHLFVGNEADLARPAILYLIGLAHGLGLKVTVAPGSPLMMSNFTAGRYGARGGEAALRPKFICGAGVIYYENELNA